MNSPEYNLGRRRNALIDSGKKGRTRCVKTNVSEPLCPRFQAKSEGGGGLGLGGQSNEINNNSQRLCFNESRFKVRGQKRAPRITIKESPKARVTMDYCITFLKPQITFRQWPEQKWMGTWK